mmetsp:Transcript_4055/g.9666  ORF Transcript_4055/g.9666 Transcript_4055/m.9666 type:complete len:130 (+) Transcript_4055:642-1031(+)
MPGAATNTFLLILGSVFFHLAHQSYVADLLSWGVPALIYAGDADFVCNWYGNKAWTLALDWAGKGDFNAAPDLPWPADAAPDGGGWGEARSAGGFTFLRVFGAGHMVPMDQPEASLEMLNTFISGGAFA